MSLLEPEYPAMQKESTPSFAAQWLIPVVISVVVTGGTIMLTIGADRNRLAAIEQRVERNEIQAKQDKIDLNTRFDRLESKIDNTLSKEDFREFKQELRNKSGSR